MKKKLTKRKGVVIFKRFHYDPEIHDSVCGGSGCKYFRDHCNLDVCDICGIKLYDKIIVFSNHTEHYSYFCDS